MKKKIAIFVSGRGSNAAAIIQKEQQYCYHVELIVVSNINSPAIKMAEDYNINCHVLDKNEFQECSTILSLLRTHQIELIVLAGFLWKIPTLLIQAYPEKIINMHPSLLPKFGGKGMYGIHVHQAVIDNQEKETGITIHFVNEKYDEGKIIFQEKIAVLASDSAESLANRVLELEHHSYAMSINKLCVEEYFINK